ILGGGIAALTAAYELSRTEEFRKKYSVDLYQMGWRLGGKLASGRNQDQNDRNEEHGLHIWFGFYENAFAVLRDCYDELLRLEPDFHFARWSDAFKKHSYTPVGQQIDGRYSYWDVNWPENADEPGTGGISLTPWGYITEFINLIRIIIESFFDQNDDSPDGEDLPDWIVHSLGRALEKSPSATVESVSLKRGKGVEKKSNESLLGANKAIDFLEAARRLLLRFAGTEESDGPEFGISAADEDEIEAIRWLLTTFRKYVLQKLGDYSDSNVDAHHIRNAMDVGIAFVLGIINPKYGILEDWDLNRIDYLDFRQWLIENGGDQKIVNEWSVMRAYYDTPFAYQGGDTDRPSWAAGSAARALIRICTQYKGAVLYQVQSGMGEALIAPIYRVLKERGVRFHFFRKVKHLELNESKTAIKSIRLDIQAETKSGDPYDPVFKADNLLCWPSEPLWDQLKDGATLKQNKVNFESHWNSWPAVGSETLHSGQNFDSVILGISLGAFKVLNEEGSLASELIASSSRFRTMTEKLDLIPTFGIQLWMKKSNAELGWKPEEPELCEPCHCRPASPGGAEPVDVWADMTQVLKVEGWPQKDPPRSLHYFCGPFNTDLYRRPSDRSATPAEGYEAVYRIASDWFGSYAYSMWQNALNGKDSLDWNELYGPDSSQGPERLKDQFLRANIDPTETVVGSFADSIQYRMGAASGFDNLYLAGAWTKNGMNVTCVEGAVMSGMAASRAISGFPETIVGEDFMQANNPGSMPRHSSMLGHGQISVQPPGVFTNARCYAFGIDVDPEAITARAQTFLGSTTDGSVRVRAVGSTAVVTYMNVEKLTTPAQSVGWIPDREWAIWTLLAVSVNGEPERIYWWMPYLIIDNLMGQVAGYEGWGFLKNLGTLNLPMEAGDPALFTASTTLFRTLNPNTKGEYAELCRVYKDGNLGWLESAIESVADLGKWILGIFEKGTLKDDIELIRLFWNTITEQQVPVLNLKQFRDSVDPELACYQALTLCPLQVNQFHRAGFVPGDFRLRLNPVESHQIKSDLGLKDFDVPVTFATYIEMDFQTTPGSILWKG
ncbi:MAG: NAD(P)-binding protein, partial [Leptospiraceae bacterium]|nr:NAD(P)-binding protein [Leptospiraceae bacterium]